tara:strand:+ start:216 stop:794 length:579 start_codon:yes stop_codon:yes gene_type:complete
MDIDFEKFGKAQDYLMFFIHLNGLIESGAATFDESNNKVINLSYDATNIFAFGRDENMRPFIAVQESFLPWFFNLDWSEINILVEGNRAFIYLISKAENGEINFAYGLRVKPKRLVVLFDRKRENLEDTFCSLKVGKIGEVKGEILTSFNNPVSNLKIKLINSVGDMIAPNEEEEKYNPNLDPNSMTFVKNK